MGDFIKWLFVDPEMVHGGRAWREMCEAIHSEVNDTHLYEEVTCDWGEGYGFIVMLSHMCVYGFVLYVAADLIGKGSELLLLIPSMRDIVGSVVIPVFATVPDTVLVCFSVLSAADAGGAAGDEKLEVGIGALAGSTVMVLTMPWFLCCLQGRVDIDSKGCCDYSGKRVMDNGQMRVRKLTKARGWAGLSQSGIEIESSVKRLVILMFVTGLFYAIIQAPALLFAIRDPDQTDEEMVEAQSTYMLVGGSLCLFNFVVYLAFCMRRQLAALLGLQSYASDGAIEMHNSPAEVYADEVRERQVRRGKLDIITAFVDELAAAEESDARREAIYEQRRNAKLMVQNSPIAATGTMRFSGRSASVGLLEKGGGYGGDNDDRDTAQFVTGLKVKRLVSSYFVKYAVREEDGRRDRCRPSDVPKLLRELGVQLDMYLLNYEIAALLQLSAELGDGGVHDELKATPVLPGSLNALHGSAHETRTSTSGGNQYLGPDGFISLDAFCVRMPIFIKEFGALAIDTSEIREDGSDHSGHVDSYGSSSAPVVASTPTVDGTGASVRHFSADVSSSIAVSTLRSWAGEQSQKRVRFGSPIISSIGTSLDEKPSDTPSQLEATEAKAPSPDRDGPLRSILTNSGSFAEGGPDDNGSWNDSVAKCKAKTMPTLVEGVPSSGSMRRSHRIGAGKARELENEYQHEGEVVVIDAGTYDGGEPEHEDEEEEMKRKLYTVVDPVSGKAKLNEGRVIRDAFKQICCGTVLVFLFSDPMIDTLASIGYRIGISGFFVAFLVAPMASNATELVVAWRLPKRKTRGTVTVVNSMALAACITNNTLVLGALLLLMQSLELPWRYGSETIAMLIVEWSILFFAFRPKNRSTLLECCVLLALFPASLGIVVALRGVGINEGIGQE